MKSAFALYIAIIISIFFVSAADAKVRYPRISSSLRWTIDHLNEGNGFVGSENIILYDGEILAADGSADGGTLYRVEFEDTEIPGLKVPALHILNMTYVPAVIRPESPMYYMFPDGSMEVWGKIPRWVSSEISVYAFSTILNGKVTWQANFTWGAGSDIDVPGKEIDRVQFGEDLPYGVPPFPGFALPDLEIAGGAVTLSVFRDEAAEITVERSSDLKTWFPVASRIEAIPELDMNIDGVLFQTLLVYPELPAGGFGKKQFFRIRG